MKLTITLVLLIVFSTPAEGRQQAFEPATDSIAFQVSHESFRRIHLSDTRRSVDQSTSLHLPNAARHFDLGDTLTFNIRGFLGRGWTTEPFVLKAEGEGYLLWVATREIDQGMVTDQDIDSLSEALGERTPPGSVNPEAGILENNLNLFGETLDYDNNGLVHVLWYDIRDDFIATGQYIAGYVSSADVDPAAASGEGNQADVMYLDTDPLLTHPAFGIEDVQEQAAHQHQHLSHLRADPDEIRFVDEGLAELAVLLNGYEGSDIEYLNVSNFSYPEHNFPLFFWDDARFDFQRAGLFATYLSDQFGFQTIRAILERREHGVQGYTAALDSMGVARTFADLVLDFHTANYLNRTDLDSRFGYTTPRRQTVRTIPSVLREGSRATRTRETDLRLQPGGVWYPVWENVENFELTIDRSGRKAANAAASVRARVLLEDLDGMISIEDLDPDTSTRRFEGRYQSITVVLVHTEPEAAAEDIVYSARWDGTAYPVENVQYDDSQVIENGFFALAAGAQAQVATRFTVLPGAVLDRVYLANYYLNQFVQNGIPVGSPNDPRDFTLYIWSDDGAGRPGNVIWSMEMTDPRPFTFAEFDFNPYPIDLSAYASDLSALPDTVYVGFGEAGSDENFTVVGPSRTAGENTSFIWDGSTWTRLWDQQLSNGVSVQNTTLPIRVKFRLPSSSVAAGDDNVPSELLTLGPNYPNPFGDETQITYHIDRAGPVRMVVYDVLGREVAVPVRADQAPGQYTVRLHTSDWSAGVYLYSLELGGRKLTRKMTHVE